MHGELIKSLQHLLLAFHLHLTRDYLVLATAQTVRPLHLSDILFKLNVIMSLCL